MAAHGTVRPGACPEFSTSGAAWQRACRRLSSGTSRALCTPRRPADGGEGGRSVRLQSPPHPPTTAKPSARRAGSPGTEAGVGETPSRSELLEGDDDLADPNAVAAHVGPVEQPVVAQEPHPVVKARAQRFDTAVCRRDRQVDRVIPVERVAAFLAGRQSDHPRCGTFPRVGAGLLERPDAALGGAVLVDEILHEPQPLAVPVTAHLDLEPATDRAEEVLELAMGDETAVEEFLEIELPVGKLLVVERGRAAGREGEKREGGEKAHGCLPVCRGDTRGIATRMSPDRACHNLGPRGARRAFPGLDRLRRAV